MSRIKKLYPQYESWQTGTNIFIISDTHFGDRDREYMGYPSEREQIKIINKGLYGKHSTLIHLGDVGDPEYMKWIKCGKKILILGNHDKGKNYYSDYFDEVYEGAVLIAPQILLSHEPTNVPWGVNIHGHDHGGMQVFEHKYRDISVEKIQNYILGVNLAANVVGFQPFNLNFFVNNGGLKGVPTIHRLAIDYQQEHSIKPVG